MQLSELIEELQEALSNYGDCEVRVGANYGDYHKTLQALYVKEVMQVRVYESAYSHSGEAVVRCDDDDDIEYDENGVAVESEDDRKQVLLISSEWVSR